MHAVHIIFDTGWLFVARLAQTVNMAPEDYCINYKSLASFRLKFNVLEGQLKYTQ
jgi:hypothetical protein